jgi:(p)ppGpp synthase/HD superfamily hydrolase
MHPIDEPGKMCLKRWPELKAPAICAEIAHRNVARLKTRMTITLERAISLAALAHEGQTDKANAPYILHSLRVMQCQTTTEAQIVAVFHDVLEKCPDWDVARVEQEGFTPEMIRALNSLTNLSGEEFEDSVRRAAADSIGCTVKLASLRDHMDIERSAEIAEADLTRVEKYERALKLL